ncbi:hypothetical protein NQ318_003566 [Aromia moschata]|uniref:HEAT repeat-containing protein 5B n=1 Tax=Aromia moschata TaxID=1265417 RepID=A0AAV8YVF7_9CUCU|nr:hypothetical protein NQ318_003566 [Aromia moschata]
MNVFTALLSGLKGLTETKVTLNQEDIKKSAVNLIISSLTSSNPILRCAAGEAVGRIAQVISDPKFTAELAQTSFDRLKSARDVASRTGHSLALGCLHKYVGGMGSSQHLNTSVSILLALAQDQTSPVVQVWSLHALALIVDSGGPMFRGYVEPSLSLALKLLLNVPQSFIDVHQCIGKVLSALITTIGPELQGNTSSICTARSSLLCACAIMQDHQDPLVQAEATRLLAATPSVRSQACQSIIFGPDFMTLSSNHLLLRKAAISCLRQLAQREAKEVCEHALTLASESRDHSTVEGLLITETGLPGVFFSMLDTETDAGLIKDIHDTIINTNGEDHVGLAVNEGEENDLEADDDQVEFHAEEDSSHPAVQPRWPTRVFAAECVRKIIAACEASNKTAHFDLIQAKEIQLSKGKNDFLALHLSDLIRMAFIAATSDSDPLRLEGLKTLQDIIEKFARVPEPEFPGHLLLEQFQAQVGAALRPAFSPDTSSLVTAAACEVCSTWIGSNVARDLNDLRRVHQLLVSSLTKLQNKNNMNQLYNESLSTLEKLAILKAWAEVYVVAMKSNESSPMVCLLQSGNNVNNNEFNDFEYSGESLLILVQPELSVTARRRDLLHERHDGIRQAVLRLVLASDSPRSGPLVELESFDDSAKEISNDNTVNNNKPITNTSDKFYLLFGICLEALCSPRSVEPLESIVTCPPGPLHFTQHDVHAAVAHVRPAVGDRALQRIAQLLCLEVLKQIIKAAQEQLEEKKKNKSIDEDAKFDVDMLGEGGESGKLVPGKSLVFAVLEVCLCLLIRQLPALSPSPNSTISCEQSGQLLAASFSCMENLHRLCSPKGAIAILPTVLYLTTGLIKEVATKNINDTTVLATDPYCKHPEVNDNWQKLLQSALAKMIDLAKTGSEETKLDEVTMMLAIAVFVLHAPSKVVIVPSLQYPCINHFRQSLENPNPMVRLKCVKTLKSLFVHPDRRVAIPYIHTLAPQLVRIPLLRLCTKSIQMLTLLVPVLVSYLIVEPAVRSANKYSQSLHEISLQWLMKIGPKYPQEFKRLMTQTDSLRIKLENAIRSSQTKYSKTKNDVNVAQPLSSHTPTIKLKTDFSNFFVDMPATVFLL